MGERGALWSNRRECLLCAGLGALQARGERSQTQPLPGGAALWTRKDKPSP